MPNETVASKTFAALRMFDNSPTPACVDVVEASFAQGLEDKIERLKRENHELEVKLYGDPPTDAEVAEFLATEHKLTPEEEQSLAKAKEAFPSALKEVSLRIRAEKERDSLRQQVAMDTVRFKEMQEHGFKVEGEMDELRQQLADANKEVQRAWGVDISHVTQIAFLEGNIQTLVQDKQSLIQEVHQLAAKLKQYESNPA